MSRKRGPPAPLPTTEIVAMVRAVVRAVPENMGPYAVAYPTGESATRVLTTRTAITFSLSANCWRDDVHPRYGQMVVLGSLREFEKGWRALKARPITPEESAEQQAEAGERS